MNHKLDFSEIRDQTKHSELFKLEAVNLVRRKGYSVENAARVLDINVETLRSWLRGDLADYDLVTVDDLEMSRQEILRLRDKLSNR